MKLAQLISALGSLVVSVPQTGDLEIQGVTNRAQQVIAGGLFVAVKGFAADGHSYIDRAAACGAAAVVCEHPAADVGAGDPGDRFTQSPGASGGRILRPSLPAA
jgi:UDP-N-acetylmuramoyl-L-alanyl-D-glutamate--2,6-diaminopimelate ligase